MKQMTRWLSPRLRRLFFTVAMKAFFFLGFLNTQVFADVSNKSVLHESGNFHVSSRLSQITKAPCKGCHSDSMKKNVQIEKAHTHPEISRSHPGEVFKGCQTCHNTETGNLQLLSKQELGFNHSYKVCAQCHQSQRKDWEGGAHGKRLSPWSKNRVIANCTQCHNPHKPGFPKKRPEALISISRKGKTNAQTH